MAKTLKQFKQGYTPKSADEKKFVDKHTVQKTPDANGNQDDVFNAKNVKAYDRELEHGYNPGSDEDVYESVNEGAPALIAGAGLAGLAGFLAKRAAEKNMGAQAIKRRVDKGEQEALQNVKEQKRIPVPDDGATADPGVDPKTNRRPIITQGPNKGKEWTKDAPGPTNPQYKPLAEPEKKSKPSQSKQPVVEKKLTSAEMKKREEVAKAIERENPNMPMAKKMAIATATAKKVAEEKDVPFEGPYKKKTDAHGPKSRAKHLAKMAMQKAMQKDQQEKESLKKQIHQTVNQAATEAAAAAVEASKKKVDEAEIKNYLLSVYASQLSEEDNQVLQEMLETEEGTKIAFMISMLIEDEQMLDEVMKKSEKYSHRSFLNKLNQTNTGA